MASPHWYWRFMRRQKLSIRQCTTVGQKLPDDWKEKSKSFRAYVQKIITDNKLTMSKIGNMDEVTFDEPPNHTDRNGRNER